MKKAAFLLALLFILSACGSHTTPAPVSVTPPPSVIPSPSSTPTPNATERYQGTLQANQTQNAEFGVTQAKKQTEIAQTQSVQALAPSATPTITITPTPTVFFTPTPNPVTGLIVTLGDKVSSPWFSSKLAFSPDGTLIAMTGRKIRVWNLYTHDLMYVFNNTHLKCSPEQIAFSPDGKLLAVSSIYCWEGEYPGFLNIYDLSSNSLIQEWTLENAKMYEPYHSDYLISVGAFTFLPSSTEIAFANGNTVEIRDIYQVSEPNYLELGEKMFASQISLSGDGQFLLILMEWNKWNTFPSLYKDQFGLQIWDLETYSLNKEIDYPEIESVSEGMSLYNEWISHIIFDNATFEMTNLITSETKAFPYRKGWRTLSTDRKYIVFTRFFGFDKNEQEIELWNTDTWRNLYIFTPRFGSDWYYGPIDIVFSPNNKILAISHQEQLSLWNIEPIIYP